MAKRSVTISATFLDKATPDIKQMLGAVQQAEGVFKKAHEASGKAGQSFHETGDQARAGAEGIKHLAGEIAAFLGVAVTIEKAKQFVLNYAEALHKLGDEAAAFGMTAKELGALQFASTQLGLSADTLPAIFVKVSKFLQQTGEKGKEAAILIKALRLNFDELKKADPDKAFLKILGALKELGPTQSALSAGAEIFGKTEKEVAVLIAAGNEEIKKQIDYYKENSGVTQKNAEDAKNFEIALGQLHLAAWKLVNESGLIPWLASVAEAWSKGEFLDPKGFLYWIKVQAQAAIDKLKELDAMARSKNENPPYGADDSYSPDDPYYTSPGLGAAGGATLRGKLPATTPGTPAAKEELFPPGYEEEEAKAIKAWDAFMTAKFVATKKGLEDEAAAQKKAAAEAEAARKKAEADEKRAAEEYLRYLEKERRAADEFQKQLVAARITELKGGVTIAEAELNAFKISSDVAVKLGRMSPLEQLQQIEKLEQNVLDLKKKEAAAELLTAGNKEKSVAALEKLKLLQVEQGTVQAKNDQEAMAAADAIIAKAREADTELKRVLSENKQGSLLGIGGGAADKQAIDDFTNKIKQLHDELTSLFAGQNMPEELKKRLIELGIIAKNFSDELTLNQKLARDVGGVLKGALSEGIGAIAQAIVHGTKISKAAVEEFFLTLIGKIIAAIAVDLVLAFLENIVGLGTPAAAGAATFSSAIAGIGAAFGSLMGMVSGAGHAEGGAIPGHDPYGRDDVNARLTRGEYVHKVAAVDYYGSDFMEAVNNMQLPRYDPGRNIGIVSRGTPRTSFASGGAVIAASPGVAPATAIIVASEEQREVLFKNSTAFRKELVRAGIGGNGRR